LHLNTFNSLSKPHLKILRHNRDNWREEVMGLQVMVLTYPVLIHRVSIKSVKMNDKKGMFELLRFENRHWAITKWSTINGSKDTRRARRMGSLSLSDFEIPEGTNATIKAGTIAWYHGLHPTKKCDNAQRLCWRASGHNNGPRQGPRCPQTLPTRRSAQEGHYLLGQHGLAYRP
jgi:hypothetical protein